MEFNRFILILAKIDLRTKINNKALELKGIN